MRRFYRGKIEVLPKTESDVFSEVAVKAMEQEVAKIKMSGDEIYEEVSMIVKTTQEKLRKLMELEFIPEPS